MQNFPPLKEEHVVLMRANTLKGYILDELFVVAVDEKQIVYTIIDGIDEALKIAKEIIKENKDIECVIYDRNQKVLSFIRLKDILSF